MTHFSEESLLVARNWDTVEDIIKAKEQLSKDLFQILSSIQPELAKLDWWQDRWRFVRSGDAQVYITNERWLGTGQTNYAVWIGVENFEPGHVFGQSTPPGMYVWVPNQQRDLANALVNRLQVEDWDIWGEIDSNANCYVVRDNVQKCLTDEIETYPETVRRQIVEFMTHYADVLLKLDPVIQEYIKS